MGVKYTLRDVVDWLLVIQVWDLRQAYVNVRVCVNVYRHKRARSWLRVLDGSDSPVTGG